MVYGPDYRKSTSLQLTNNCIFLVKVINGYCKSQRNVPCSRTYGGITIGHNTSVPFSKKSDRSRNKPLNYHLANIKAHQRTLRDIKICVASLLWQELYLAARITVPSQSSELVFTSPFKALRECSVSTCITKQLFNKNCTVAL